MLCPRCKNDDINYFYLGSKGYYCRKCIMFKRQLLLDDINVIDYQEIDEKASYNYLPYKLSTLQKNISDKCAKYIIKHDVLLHCVCGAGKTEIVLKSIENALIKKQKVGFAISRRQVVLEIKQRLEHIFKKANVINVCAGYTDILDGDIIVCTTHQLYRYYQTFDLLILDEPDAFPYKGNMVLKGICENSCKGQTIFLTATLDDYLKKRILDKSLKYLVLNKRPHNYDLPVPKLKVGIRLYLIYELMKFIKEHDEKIIVFVPTKKIATILYRFFKWYIKCQYIYSGIDRQDEIIDDFKKGKYKVIFATTILERGITIKGVLVVIYLSEHKIFDEASLIQMLGRVGRSFEQPTGDCLILSDKYPKLAKDVIATLKRANNEKV